MTGCPDVRHDLGVYALGALPSDEEDRVREHLASCSDCRHEHARLAAMRPLLDLAEPGAEHTAAGAEPSPLLEDAVLAGFAAGRSGGAPRRRSAGATGSRWAPLAVASAAAGAAIALAVLALSGAFSGSDPVRETPAVELRGAAGSASATIAPADAGTTIKLDARLPPSRSLEDIYEVWMVSGDYRVSAGSFRVDADGRVSVRLTCGGPPAAYDTIAVTRHDAPPGRAPVLTAAL